VGLEGVPLDRDLDGKLKYIRLSLRGGFGYAPSPLVRQGTGTAFLDADRLVFAGGLGVEHGAPWGHVKGPLSWDLYFQGHLLASGSLKLPDDEAYTAGAPVDGKAIPIGGRLWTAGLQWSMEY